MVRCLPYAPGFSREQSARPNHHAIIYRRVANPTLGLLVPAQSRTNVGHISISSYYTKQFSLSHHAHHIQPYPSTRWTGQTLLIGLPLIPAHPAPIPCRFLLSDNCPEYPSIQLLFAIEPTSNRSPHRQWKRFTTHPQQSTNTHQFHCSHILNLPYTARAS